MKKLTFNCTFLSDVILNASSATAGTTEVLDYIPGAKFLGIVAKKHYEEYEADTESILNIFYNGNVRFGDAHLLCKEKRSLKMPLDFFYGKNKEEEGKIWIRHLIDNDEDKRIRKENIQLKQKRSGYFLPTESKELSTKDLFSYSLKSAYDADKRRSKDQQMYGYNALKKGTVWQFTVELDDMVSNFEAQIISALVGERSLGKSRSAQYGRVKIEAPKENPVNQFKSSGTGKTFVLYAESNLCFVDKNGQFTVTPTAQELGFSKNAKIDWTKSQIRHRVYAPWNVKRSTRDADRWIIEKGSVFIVECGTEESINLEKGVGLFTAEGYGKVLVNPTFLINPNLTLTEEKLSKEKLVIQNSLKDEKVTALLNFRKDLLSPENAISKAVSLFVRAHDGKFDNISNSQWGQIRNIVQHVNNEYTLDVLLFSESVGFCCTAKRKNEWRGQKITLLKNLVKDKSFKEQQELLTMLASEMAKIEKTDKNDNKA